MKLCSIVVPCYNEEEAIPLFYRRLCHVMEDLEELRFEIVLIDDGSRDKTLEVIKELQKKDQRIHYISFSKNFGKEAGIYAGLRWAKGDYVATMDVDLQDPPELLREMYQKLKDGQWDCAAARRVTRKGEPRLRSFCARQFYQLMRRISDLELADGARDFRMMSRPMVEAVLSLKEYNRFSKGIFSWVGFRTCWLDYENRERAAGETKWSFWKLFRYSIEGIVAFSTVPLSVASVIGTALCILAFLALLWNPLAANPVLSFLILLLSGIQLLCMGIMGLYVARTYLESKKRPLYLVRESK